MYDRLKQQARHFEQWMQERHGLKLAHRQALDSLATAHDQPSWQVMRSRPEVPLPHPSAERLHAQVQRRHRLEWSLQDAALALSHARQKDATVGLEPAGPLTLLQVLGFHARNLQAYLREEHRLDLNSDQAMQATEAAYAGQRERIMPLQPGQSTPLDKARIHHQLRQHLLEQHRLPLTLEESDAVGRSLLFGLIRPPDFRRTRTPRAEMPAGFSPPEDTTVQIWQHRVILPAGTDTLPVEVQAALKNGPLALYMAEASTPSRSARRFLLNLLRYLHLDEMRAQGPLRQEIESATDQETEGRSPLEVLHSIAVQHARNSTWIDGLNDWERYRLDEDPEALLAWMLHHLRSRRHKGVYLPEPTVLRVTSGERLLAFGLYDTPPNLPNLQREEVPGLRSLMWRIQLEKEERRNAPFNPSIHALRKGQTDPRTEEQRQQQQERQDRAEQRRTLDVQQHRLASQLWHQRRALHDAGVSSEDIRHDPQMWQTIADLLRNELHLDGFQTEGLDPDHLADEPDFGLGYSLWRDGHFELAFGLNGRQMNLTSRLTGVSPEAQRHFEAAERRLWRLINSRSSRLGWGL